MKLSISQSIGVGLAAAAICGTGLGIIAGVGAFIGVTTLTALQILGISGAAGLIAGVVTQIPSSDAALVGNIMREANRNAGLPPGFGNNL